jgi:hypothetical protein
VRSLFKSSGAHLAANINFSKVSDVSPAIFDKSVQLSYQCNKRLYENLVTKGKKPLRTNAIVDDATHLKCYDGVSFAVSELDMR